MPLFSKEVSREKTSASGRLPSFIARGGEGGGDSPTTTESPSSLFAEADAAPADEAAALTFFDVLAFVLVAVRLLALALGLETVLRAFAMFVLEDRNVERVRCDACSAAAVVSSRLVGKDNKVIRHSQLDEIQLLIFFWRPVREREAGSVGGLGVVSCRATLLATLLSTPRPPT